MSCEDGYGTAGGSHGTWDLRSRQCDACMPFVAKMTVRLAPTGTTVSRNGFLIDLDLQHPSRLSMHDFPSVRHVAASVTEDLSLLLSPEKKPVEPPDGGIDEHASYTMNAPSLRDA